MNKVNLIESNLTLGSTAWEVNAYLRGSCLPWDTCGSGTPGSSFVWSCRWCSRFFRHTDSCVALRGGGDTRGLVWRWVCSKMSVFGHPSWHRQLSERTKDPLVLLQNAEPNMLLMILHHNSFHHHHKGHIIWPNMCTLNMLAIDWNCVTVL